MKRGRGDEEEGAEKKQNEPRLRRLEKWYGEQKATCLWMSQMDLRPSSGYLQRRRRHTRERPRVNGISRENLGTNGHSWEIWAGVAAE